MTIILDQPETFWNWLTAYNAKQWKRVSFSSCSVKKQGCGAGAWTRSRSVGAGHFAWSRSWSSNWKSGGRPVARISQQGGQTSPGEGTFLKYNIGCMQEPPLKQTLVTCKAYSHLTPPRKLYRYERRTGWSPSFALLQLGQAKIQKIAYFANRWNCSLLVDCPRVSPLPLAPSFMSHQLAVFFNRGSAVPQVSVSGCFLTVLNTTFQNIQFPKNQAHYTYVWRP